jgi:hypothetical protein
LPPSELRGWLTRHCESGNPEVRLTADGVVLSIRDLKWEASWATISDAVAFGEFFVTGAEGSLFDSFTEAVRELGDAGDVGERLDGAVRILSRRIAQWRRDKLPLGRMERLFTALVGFLTARPGDKRGSLAFDDDDIVEFWRSRVQAGDRLLFRTVVERFRDFARLAAELRVLRNLGSTVDVELLAGRLQANDTEADTGEEAPEVRLVEALRNLPTEPKALTGPERDLLSSIVNLLPFQDQRPCSVLRVLAFGPVQGGIANFLRRGGGGASISERVTCGEAESYADLTERFDGLRGHLDRLLRIATALRFGVAAADGEPPARLAETIRQGFAELDRMRRAGFDRPREELAAAFAQSDELLVDLRTILDGFVKELERVAARRDLTARFDVDRPVFAEILTQAYLEQEESEPNVDPRS